MHGGKTLDEILRFAIIRINNNTYKKYIEEIVRQKILKEILCRKGFEGNT